MTAENTRRVPDHDHEDEEACFVARCDRFFMDVEVREHDQRGRLVRIERHPRPATDGSEQRP